MTSSACLRVSLGIFFGTALLHLALGGWLGESYGLLLAAPSLVLSVTTWLMRKARIVWFTLGVLAVLEVAALAVYLSAEASTGNVIVYTFAIAASSVQIPIAALVAAVRYFETAD